MKKGWALGALARQVVPSACVSWVELGCCGDGDTCRSSLWKYTFAHLPPAPLLQHYAFSSTPPLLLLSSIYMLPCV